MAFKANKYLLWFAGFVVIFIINVIVESTILPYFGLDNTDKNDIYFQLWWVVVGLWLLFGLKLINYCQKK